MMSVDPETERADRAARGREIRRELLGDAKVSSGRGPSDVLAPDLGELSDQVLWGTLWARDGLDLRTKSLITISALLACGHDRHFRIHVAGARNIGISKDELASVAVHLTFYVGLPRVHNALAIIAEVFADEMPGQASL